MAPEATRLSGNRQRLWRRRTWYDPLDFAANAGTRTQYRNPGGDVRMPPGGPVPVAWLPAAPPKSTASPDTRCNSGLVNLPLAAIVTVCY